MEEAVKNAGFTSLNEFNELISCLDLSDVTIFNLFSDWKINDGTKAGFMSAFNINGCNNINSDIGLEL
jgi:hypothetical protein